MTSPAFYSSLVIRHSTLKMSNVTFYDRVEDAIAHPEKHQAVGVGAKRFMEKRLNAVDAYDEMDAMRDHGRKIRAHTLKHLDQYLEQFVDNVERLGGTVFFAKDAAEANLYVTQLAKEKGVKKAIKSKSMVTEEIHLNDALEQAGVTPIESDLGEYIIQLAGERPSHIIAPVMHRTRQDVGELFAEKLGIDYTDDPEALNKVARSNLRKEFLSADMGISGCNFAVAESGTISLVTNEGNARLTTAAPRIHVALMGMERIVPTFEDLGVMLQILARSATGQKLTVYSTLLSGPRRLEDGEDDGPEEMHVVILDNGRSRTLGSELAPKSSTVFGAGPVSTLVRSISRSVATPTVGSIPARSARSSCRPSKGWGRGEIWPTPAPCVALVKRSARSVSTFPNCCSSCGMMGIRPVKPRPGCASA